MARITLVPLSAEDREQFILDNQEAFNYGAFFNTSGQIYRDMELSKKLPTMTDDEQFSLLATDGMIVKRPLLVGDDFVLTGFKEAEWEEKLLK